MVLLTKSYYLAPSKDFLMSKKIKVQPVAPVLVSNLVTLAKQYAFLCRIKVTTVGTNSTKTASFYDDLESGKTSCTLRKYDLLTEWFQENWPEGHPMPELQETKHYRTKPTSAMQHAPTMPMSADQTVENTKLRRENEQLREERDALKKSVMIFARAN
jgi:hypothetical protein